MLHTKSQGHWPFVPENKIFKGFLPYMGMVALAFETFIAIVSLGLPYQVRIMTGFNSIQKVQLFKKKKSHLNALGSKFDLDVK